LYFLDKITDVASKFVSHDYMQQGLRVSVDLLADVRSQHASSSASTDDLLLTES